MALRFTIENVPNLPDGGPMSFMVTGKRSVDIGRDQHLDWTLPDPSRFISGKHCEVHYRNNAYWLHDVSTNGTFLNGSDQRMRSPHELKNGDRLVIGQYIVGVSLDGDSRLTSQTNSAGQASPQPVAYPELWGGDADAPPPIDRQQIKMARETARPVNPDFLDWAAGVPEVEGGTAAPVVRTPNQRVLGHGLGQRPADCLADGSPTSRAGSRPSPAGLERRRTRERRSKPVLARRRPSPPSDRQNARSRPPRRLRPRTTCRRRPKAIEARTMPLFVEWRGQPACPRTFSTEKTPTCWPINSVKSCVSPLPA